MPQYFILTALVISTNGLAVCSNLNFTIDNIVSSYSSNAECRVGGNNRTPINNITFYQMFNETKTIFGTVHLPMYYYFRVNYYTTLLSCTMGIVKFLDVGPTKILPTQGWRNYVFYALAVLSVFTSLHTRTSHSAPLPPSRTKLYALQQKAACLPRVSVAVSTLRISS